MANKKVKKFLALLDDLTEASTRLTDYAKEAGNEAVQEALAMRTARSMVTAATGDETQDANVLESAQMIYLTAGIAAFDAARQGKFMEALGNTSNLHDFLDGFITFLEQRAVENDEMLPSEVPGAAVVVMEVAEDGSHRPVRLKDLPAEIQERLQSQIKELDEKELEARKAAEYQPGGYL